MSEPVKHDRSRIGLYRCTHCGYYFLRDAEDRYSSTVLFDTGERFGDGPLRMFWFTADEHPEHRKCMNNLQKVT